MAIELGALAPAFQAASTQGPIDLHAWQDGHWCLLFSYPRDFSAVCMTELGLVERMQPEFARRKVKTLALAIAPEEKHTQWQADFPVAQGCTLSYPMLADPDGSVARLYGLVHEAHAAGVATRGYVLIDPSHKVRMFAMYPTSVGRNFDEVLRIVDSLQMSGKHGLVTPANWRPGEAAVIPPALSDEQAREKYGDQITAVMPYLRTVAIPK